jgi:PAS domain S-box-containing protein
MIILDLHNRVVDMNMACGRILGMMPSAVVGRAVTDVIEDKRLARLIRHLNDKEDVETEVTFGTGESRRYYELRISPLYDRRQQLRGRLVVLHNVTRQKTAEAALLTQKQLFQNLVAVARATAERPTLEATLQNALDVAVKLTTAELGSLFILDENSVVTHGILSRGQTTPLKQQELVGRVMDQGLAGWVVRERQAVLIPDTTADDRWLTLPDAPYDARSVLAVPIVSGTILLGILTLQHSKPQHFSEEDLHLMQASVDQMALALRNAQIYEEQRRLARQQATLYETLRAVGGHLQPGTVVHAAVGTVAALTGWTAVAILMPNESQTELIVRASSGIISAAQGQRVPISRSICGEVFWKGKTRYIAHVSAEPNYIRGHESIQSELAVPIQRGGQVLGVLDLESDRPDAFDEEDIRLAESLAETIGLALDNAHLFRVIEDEGSRLQALIQSSRDGVILVGMDQRILVMNKPAHELLQLRDSPEDWVNRSVMEALAELFEYAPLAAQATMAGVRYLNQGVNPPSEGEIEVPPRRIRWLNLPVKAGAAPAGSTARGAAPVDGSSDGSPAVDGPSGDGSSRDGSSRDGSSGDGSSGDGSSGDEALLGRLLSLRDVTEERLLGQARDDLTHTMVHDLRNPLNNIFGAQELISDLGPLTQEQEQVLDVARDSTQRMLVLVNAILDISRLEGGRMPLDRKAFRLKAAAAGVLESQLPLAASKMIQLKEGIPAGLPPVFADRILIERVLQNLVGNALTFTPVGGGVWITARIDEEKESRLLVQVEDTGPGLPPGVHERLFQKFVTGKQVGSGSGLGLAFCKMAVEAHGGRIWARNRPEGGAIFLFTLPVALEDLSPVGELSSLALLPAVEDMDF